MTLLSSTLRTIRGCGSIVNGNARTGYLVREKEGGGERRMTLSELIGWGGQRHARILPNGEFSIGGKLWPGLSKLIEECGEVCQVAGKLIGARGAEGHWDGSFLPTRLEDELADLQAAISFVIAVNELDVDRIARRTAKKSRLFLQWHYQEPDTSLQAVVRNAKTLDHTLQKVAS